MFTLNTMKIKTQTTSPRLSRKTQIVVRGRSQRPAKRLSRSRQNNQGCSHTGSGRDIQTRNTRIIRVRRVLVSAIKASTNIDLGADALKYFDWFDLQLRSRGTTGGLEFIKRVTHTAVNSILGQKDPGNSFVGTRKGFPKSIYYLRKYASSDQGIQAVNSILHYYKSVTTKAAPDLSSITTVGPDIDEELIREIVSAIPDEWKFKVNDLSTPKLRFRSKSGPNGHATLYAGIDVMALGENPELYDAVTELLEIQGGSDIVDTMEELLDEIQWEGKITHSQISVKREPGGKNRPFAIVDYWSQTALEPLHIKLMSILRTLETDCTHDQNKGVHLFKEWTKGLALTDCYDLRSATDRFPLKLLVAILEVLCGNKTFAGLWATVISQRAFRYKGHYYEWAQGQPLGAYSSWAMFTIAHHIVVRAAAIRVRRLKLLEYYYRLLGDDIAMRNRKLAHQYRDIMERLGVEINITKSMSNHSVEFCKRHFINGTEVSPIPIGLIQAFIHDPYMGLELILKIKERASLRHLEKNSVQSIIDSSGHNDHNLNNLRILISNPITGDPSLDANGSWGVKGLWMYVQGSMDGLYTLVKYKYLIDQYSVLQRGEEKFTQHLLKCPLPGLDQDLFDLHPFHTTLVQKYREMKSTSHKEIGRFWSKSVIERKVLPLVPSLNEQALEPKHRKRLRHSALAMLQYHKKVKTLIEKEQQLLNHYADIHLRPWQELKTLVLLREQYCFKMAAETLTSNRKPTAEQDGRP